MVMAPWRVWGIAYGERTYRGVATWFDVDAWTRGDEPDIVEIFQR